MSITPPFHGRQRSQSPEHGFLKYRSDSINALDRSEINPQQYSDYSQGQAQDWSAVQLDTMKREYVHFS